MGEGSGVGSGVGLGAGSVEVDVEGLEVDSGLCVGVGSVCGVLVTVDVSEEVSSAYDGETERSR